MKPFQWLSSLTSESNGMIRGLARKPGYAIAAWLLAIGLPIGLIGAFLLGQAMASTLYQTPVFDVGLYAAGIALVVAVVMTAAWGPARRAAHTPIRNLIGGTGTK